ncbi:hypothetical protein M5K25_000507 [Dendrobium thyrsiflorum]|uniref:Uncharacterized protein n=1 Tax=Dendrobium thyrsiflorum TaxID=117978 RepID=A0ABD0VU48_DENTH
MLAITSLRKVVHDWMLEAKGLIIEGDNYNVINSIHKSLNKKSKELVEDFSFLKEFSQDIHPLDNNGTHVMAENRHPFPTFRQRQRTYVLFHPPGEGREPDTMLKNFTREPPKEMGRNLKKKKTILALGNLTENPFPFSLSPVMVENRHPFPTFRQRQRTYVFFHHPGEGREPDTMLKNFTREPPEEMGRNLKKKKMILTLGNLSPTIL